MDIEVNKRNIEVVNTIISRIVEVIDKISNSRHKVKTETKELVMLDLLIRQYPNLNSINLLLIQYSDYGNKGNGLPIGLIMRCCLEDMIYAKYLLSFRNNNEVFENEIRVNGRNFIKQNLIFPMEHMSEYWKVSKEKRKRLESRNNELFKQFKKDNSEFFLNDGKLKSFKQLREDINNIEKYFSHSTLNNHGPSSMYQRIRKVDKDFSYIYFEYKYYCILEHYTFHSRSIMQLNEITFGHLCLSLEFVITGITSILKYIGEIDEYKKELKSIKYTFKKFL